AVGWSRPVLAVAPWGRLRARRTHRRAAWLRYPVNGRDVPNGETECVPVVKGKAVGQGSGADLTTSCRDDFGQGHRRLPPRANSPARDRPGGVAQEPPFNGVRVAWKGELLRRFEKLQDELLAQVLPRDKRWSVTQPKDDAVDGRLQQPDQQRAVLLGVLTVGQEQPSPVRFRRSLVVHFASCEVVRHGLNLRSGR